MTDGQAGEEEGRVTGLSGPDDIITILQMGDHV